METRRFPTIHADVSLLGYGCMRFPTLPGGEIDVPPAQAMLDLALERGVTYFDTAFPYHQQQSEPFLAQSLVARYPRDRFFLASKLATWLVSTPEEADAMFENQLRRCGVDYFDFYLAHNLCAEHYGMFQGYGGYELLARKKAEGKIRHLGFSIHDTRAHLSRVLDDHPWDFVQIQLNYLDWELQDAKGQYEEITARGLPVVVMEPVRGGSLAKLTPAALEVLERAAPGRSAAAWAIRYAASLPGVMTVLSGMSTPEQVRDNAASLTDFHPLTAAERRTLGEALALYRAAGTVPCTACRYCMPCPAGVDIPRVFAAYNQYRIDGLKGHYRNTYEYLGAAGAGSCAGCGACRPKCPQHIDIPAALAEAAGAYREIKAL